MSINVDANSDQIPNLSSSFLVFYKFNLEASSDDMVEIIGVIPDFGSKESFWLSPTGEEALGIFNSNPSLY